jgi:hypothetical protein
VKEKILELAEIAKACPENLQAICFELLLKDYLCSRVPERKSGAAEPARTTSQPTTEADPVAVEGIGKGQDDLFDRDIHVKARRFLEKYDLKLDHLNRVRLL